MNGHPSQSDLLHREVIQSYISDQNKDQLVALELLDQVDSTNSYLMRQSREGRLGPRVCLAEQQTAGRGRPGKRWFSPFGANIYLSLLVPLPREVSEFTGLGIVVVLAIFDALTEASVPHLGIKWPNDILCEGRKLSGILIESARRDKEMGHMVVGVGVNVHMPRESDVQSEIHQPWIDVYTVNAKAADRNRMAGLLIDHLMTSLLTFHRMDFPPLRERFQSLDVLRNRHIRVITSNSSVLEGLYRGIDERGGLILEEAGGIRHHFLSGEVTIDKESR